MTELRQDSSGLGVLILGCGRAGELHLECLLRASSAGALRPPHSIGLFDPRPDRSIRLGRRTAAESARRGLRWPEPAVFATLDQALAQHAANSSVIDVCAPNAFHAELVEGAIRSGARRILVEKPMFLDVEDFHRFRRPGVAVVGVHNYLYSGVTRRLGEVLRVRDLEPRRARLVFRKDRHQDSQEGRGFARGRAPHAVAVEMPHLFYLSAALFGRLRVTGCISWPMRLDGVELEGHGGAWVELVSDRGVRVTCGTPLNEGDHGGERSVRVECAGGRSVRAVYPRSRASERRGVVELLRGDQVAERWVEEDFSMDVCLLDAWARLARAPEQPRADATGMEVARLFQEAMRLDHRVSGPPAAGAESEERAGAVLLPPADSGR